MSLHVRCDSVPDKLLFGHLWGGITDVFCHRSGKMLTHFQILAYRYKSCLQHAIELLNITTHRSNTPDIILSLLAGPVGTEITVSGFGFDTDVALVSLEIGGMPCSVSSITDTQLLCNVGEHAGGTFPVIFHHKVKGYALTQSVFTYELLLTGVTPNEGN